jgi:alpha-galactosidase
MTDTPARIVALTDPEPGWMYHAGTAVYVERLIDGRLIGRSLHDTGVPWRPQNEPNQAPAFDLEADGQTLSFGWELQQADLGGGEGASAESRLTLSHQRMPLSLEIRTLATCDGIYRRSLRLTNRSPSQSIGLGAVVPWCGAVWTIANELKENLIEAGGLPYRVGWFRDQIWGSEGNFQWHDLPRDAHLAFGSDRGRSGHSSPFAIAHNNVHGGYLVAALAWTANWRMSFHTEFLQHDQCRLNVSMRPLAPAPMRILAPRESIDLPEAYFGLNHESFDACVQAWHRFVRAHVLPPPRAVQPVIYNTWNYQEHEVSEPSLRDQVDVASDIGAELFVVDAGWYADINTRWQETTGDWQCGNRLPDDLFPVFAYARGKGLRCGLWAEVESAGRLSAVAREHPDWFISRYGTSIDRILDLSRPEVAQHVEGHVCRLIERYELDLFRLDYNCDPLEGGFVLRDGRHENTLWRHVEAIHGIFDRVRRRFPKLLLENCASGGGRTDLGMLRHFDTTWVSDWMRLPRTARILNGMSIALPPERINRTAGAIMHGGYQGNLESQLHVAILAHPAISGLAPRRGMINADVLRQVKKYLELYKSFIRPFHREAQVYHHSPAIGGSDGSGWCALEYVAPDRRRALAAVFRLVNAREDAFPLRFRGLDPALRYRLTIHPGGMHTVCRAWSLLQEGWRVRLDTPLTSTLIQLEATEQ